MSRRILCALVPCLATALVALNACAARESEDESSHAFGPDGAGTPEGHQRIVRKFTDAAHDGRNVYELMFDKRVNGARWVTWDLDADDVGGYLPPEKPVFAIEPELTDEANFVRHATYKQSNPADAGPYTRGHLVPAMDRQRGKFAIAPKYQRPDGSWGNGSSTERDAFAATYVMSNVLPQTSELNEGAWNSFEAYIRSQLVTAKSNGTPQRAQVYAGPVWNPECVEAMARNPSTLVEDWDSRNTCPTVGLQPELKYRVLVPEQFFKIVVFFDASHTLFSQKLLLEPGVTVIAAMMPNKRDVGAGFCEYLTSVDAIEKATSVNFFQDVTDLSGDETSRRGYDEGDLRRLHEANEIEQKTFKAEACRLSPTAWTGGNPDQETNATSERYDLHMRCGSADTLDLYVRQRKPGRHNDGTPRSTFVVRALTDMPCPLRERIQSLVLAVPMQPFEFARAGTSGRPVVESAPPRVLDALRQSFDLEFVPRGPTKLDVVLTRKRDGSVERAATFDVRHNLEGGSSERRKPLASAYHARHTCVAKFNDADGELPTSAAPSGETSPSNASRGGRFVDFWTKSAKVYAHHLPNETLAKLSEAALTGGTPAEIYAGYTRGGVVCDPDEPGYVETFADALPQSLTERPTTVRYLAWGSASLYDSGVAGVHVRCDGAGRVSGGLYGQATGGDPPLADFAGSAFAGAVLGEPICALPWDPTLFFLAPLFDGNVDRTNGAHASALWKKRRIHGRCVTGRVPTAGLEALVDESRWVTVQEYAMPDAAPCSRNGAWTYDQ